MKLKVQKIFCAKGKSSCNIEKKGCICNKCPLATEYNLQKLYYCVTGTEE
jgi:aldose sugar dehydrogenase